MRAEPLAFPSEAHTCFNLLLIATLLAPLQWTALNPLLGIVLGFILYGILWYRNEHLIRRKYGLDSQPNAGEDEDRIIALAKRLGASIDRVQYIGNIHNTQALTLSNFGRVTILLGKGLKKIRKKDEAKHDAVVLHEIGHILNRDVLLTQRARVLLAVVFRLAVLEACIAEYNFDVLLVQWWNEGRIAANSLGSARELNWYVYLRVALLPFIFPVVLSVIYKHLLRIREFEADRFAVVGDGCAGLEKIFFESKQMTWRTMHLFASHPGPNQRLATLQKLTAFKAISPEMMAIIGFLMGLTGTFGLMIASHTNDSGPIAAVGAAVSIVGYFGSVVAFFRHLERAISLTFSAMNEVVELLMRGVLALLVFSVMSFLGFLIGSGSITSLANSQELRETFQANWYMDANLANLVILPFGFILAALLSATYLVFVKRADRPKVWEMFVLRYFSANMGVLFAAFIFSVIADNVIAIGEWRAEMLARTGRGLTGTEESLRHTFLEALFYVDLQQVLLSISVGLILLTTMGGIQHIRHRRENNHAADRNWGRLPAWMYRPRIALGLVARNATS